MARRARRSLSQPLTALEAVLVQGLTDGDFVLGVERLPAAFLGLAMLGIFPPCGERLSRRPFGDAEQFAVMAFVFAERDEAGHRVDDFQHPPGGCVVFIAFGRAQVLHAKAEDADDAIGIFSLGHRCLLCTMDLVCARYSRASRPIRRAMITFMISLVPA